MGEIEYSSALVHTIVADTMEKAITEAKSREDEDDRRYTGIVVKDKATLDGDNVYRVVAIADHNLME